MRVVAWLGGLVRRFSALLRGLFADRRAALPAARELSRETATARTPAVVVMPEVAIIEELDEEVVAPAPTVVASASVSLVAAVPPVPAVMAPKAPAAPPAAVQPGPAAVQPGPAAVQPGPAAAAVQPGPAARPVVAAAAARVEGASGLLASVLGESSVRRYFGRLVSATPAGLTIDFTRWQAASVERYFLAITSPGLIRRREAPTTGIEALRLTTAFDGFEWD